MRLIILNYSMDSRNMVFSHQLQTVAALATYFETIDVFSPQTSDDLIPQNVTVHKLRWVTNSPIRNSFRILRTLYPFLIRNRKSIVFSHMTDVHAALISPLTWFLNMRHVLWYAHAKSSLYLTWSSFFVDKIVSSTYGSCTLKVNRTKISYINQGISSLDFPFSKPIRESLFKLFYYGRLDQSKNIHSLIEVIEILNRQNLDYSLDIFGDSAKSESSTYLDRLKKRVLRENMHNIRFHQSILRKEIPAISKNFDLFINLFSGSLDKTLIEATFMGFPVITWNQEFCREFGTWSGKPPAEDLQFILNEISALHSKSFVEIQTEISRRLNCALKSHSFDIWIGKLFHAITEEKPTRSRQ